MHKKKGRNDDLLWSQGERMCVAPDDLFLLFRWVQKSEAVLKSPAIPDLSLEFQRLRHLWKLEFQFNHFTNRYFTWDRGAQSAFSNVFGAAMLYFFAFDHQTQVQQKPDVGPGLGPWMLFVRNRHWLQRPYHKCVCHRD